HPADPAGAAPSRSGEAEDLGFTLPPPSRTSRTAVIAVLVIVLGGGFAFGFRQRSKAQDRVPEPIAEARATRVEVTKPVVLQSDYSRTNTQRYASLADQKLVSKAQVEQTQAQASTDEASVASAQSNVAAQQANVRRLVETQAFSRVVAPFTGTITSRSVERGD